MNKKRRSPTSTPFDIFFARLTAGLLDRPLLRSALLRSALIAKTTDREPAVLVVVVPVHVGVIVAEIAVVRVGVIVLRSAPEEGVVAEIVVAAEVAASGKGRENSRIVGTWIVANGTSV